MAGLVIGKRATLKCSPSNCCKSFDFWEIYFCFYSSL